MSAQDEEREFGWAVLELMGHRKLAGLLSEDAGLLRIDVFLEDPGQGAAPLATQWYGRQAVYCITATTRENCLALTRTHQPAPIGRWELPEHTEPAREDWEPTDAELAAQPDEDEIPY